MLPRRRWAEQARRASREELKALGYQWEAPQVKATEANEQIEAPPVERGVGVDGYIGAGDTATLEDAQMGNSSSEPNNHSNQSRLPGWTEGALDGHL